MKYKENNNKNGDRDNDNRNHTERVTGNNTANQVSLINSKLKP